MKSVSSLFVMAVVALSLGVSGCAKEDPAKPLEVDWNRTGTVKGTILINPDITKAADEQKYSAPAITSSNFVVSIPYADLNAGAGGTYIIKDKLTYNSSTGEFTVTVPVGVGGARVTIKMSDFEGTLKKEVGGTDKTVDVIWKASTKSVTNKEVAPGAVVYLDNWILDPAASSACCEDIKKDGSFVNP
jgi:hypothetical protein